MVEKAIAFQHRRIASTLGRMAEPALVALGAKLAEYCWGGGNARSGQRAEATSEAGAICESVLRDFKGLRRHLRSGPAGVVHLNHPVRPRLK
jgi:hypothetical protein